MKDIRNVKMCAKCGGALKRQVIGSNVLKYCKYCGSMTTTTP